MSCVIAIHKLHIKLNSKRNVIVSVNNIVCQNNIGLPRPAQTNQRTPMNMSISVLNINYIKTVFAYFFCQHAISSNSLSIDGFWHEFRIDSYLTTVYIISSWIACLQHSSARHEVLLAILPNLHTTHVLRFSNVL